MMAIPLEYYLLLGAFLFALGVFVVLTKRNTTMLLIGIELLLNASNINLVAFSQYDKNLNGQVFSLFVMVVAAAETAVGLAIILRIYRDTKASNPDEFDSLNG
jgi:NADH:ubiquinone oxidoreductase subunit K